MTTAPASLVSLALDVHRASEARKRDLATDFPVLQTCPTVARWIGVGMGNGGPPHCGCSACDANHEAREAHGRRADGVAERPMVSMERIERALADAGSEWWARGTVYRTLYLPAVGVDGSLVTVPAIEEWQYPGLTAMADAVRARSLEAA